MQPRMRGDRLGGWIALAAALLVAAGALLPVPPQLLAALLDPSFAATLHFGAAHGYKVGTDLISPFGPLGFVFYDQYSSETYVALLAVRASLAAVTVWALAWMGYAAWRSPWGAALAVVVAAPFLALPDVWFLTLPLWAVLVDLPSERGVPAPLRAGLGIAIGLVAMIKFTCLVAAVAVLVPLAAADLLARRRAPVTAIAACVMAALIWIATGHSGADWLRYLDWSVREISPGYESAMQLPITGRLVAHAVLVCLAVFVAGVVLIERRLGSGRRAAEFALAAVLALLLKAGFVRADVHVFITCFGLVAVGALLALLWSRRPRELLVPVLLLVLLPGGLCADALAVVGRPWLYFVPVFPPQAIARLAALPFVLTGDALAHASAARAAEIGAAVPFPPLKGTVDVYSYDQAAVLAQGLDFHPRPVFQSYMAYTPRLAQANAEHLLGANAPEWILFRAAAIDGRLPAFDDAPSWPLFLARYRFVDRAGWFALLQRRADPLPWRLERLGSVQAQTGDLINVPSAADGPIWARVDVHETRRDAAVAALLGGSVTYIGIGRLDNKARAYRLLPALAREGFLLSPVVETTADFVRLFSSDRGGDHSHDATAITIQFKPAPGVDPGPRSVDIEFSRLVVGPEQP
jgi:hypothetical protein